MDLKILPTLAEDLENVLNKATLLDFFQEFSWVYNNLLGAVDEFGLYKTRQMLTILQRIFQEWSIDTEAGELEKSVCSEAAIQINHLLNDVLPETAPY